MTDSQHKIESNCWSNLKQGDPQALAYLYDAYVEKLFAVAMQLTSDRNLAKDTIQEVFIELWKYRESITVNHTQAYLVKVLRSILIKKLKRQNAIVQIHEDDSIASGDLSAEEIFVNEDLKKENKNRLQQAFSKLTGRQKMILELHFYEGLSYQQIAEKLMMNYQSVNNLIFRTILRLRQYMHLLLIIAGLYLC